MFGYLFKFEMICFIVVDLLICLDDIFRCLCICACFTMVLVICVFHLPKWCYIFYDYLFACLGDMFILIFYMFGWYVYFFFICLIVWRISRFVFLFFYCSDYLRICWYVCLFVYLICLFVCLFIIFLFIRLFICLVIQMTCLFFCVFLDLFRWYVYLSVYFFFFRWYVYLSVWLYICLHDVLIGLLFDLFVQMIFLLFISFFWWSFFGYWFICLDDILCVWWYVYLSVYFFHDIFLWLLFVSLFRQYAHLSVCLFNWWCGVFIRFLYLICLDQMFIWFLCLFIWFDDMSICSFSVYMFMWYIYICLLFALSLDRMHIFVYLFMCLDEMFICLVVILFV